MLVRPPMATVRCFTEPPALRKFCKLVPSTQLRDTMAPRPPSLSTGTLAEPCRLLARLFRIKDSVCFLRLTKPHPVGQASLGPRMPVRRTQRPDLWRNMIQDCQRRDDIKLPLQSAKISLSQPLRHSACHDVHVIHYLPIMLAGPGSGCLDALTCWSWNKNRPAPAKTACKTTQLSKNTQP
jgi:hypothetical protein